MASRHPIKFAEAKNDSTIWGRFIESIVGTHLINSITGEDVNLGYWREGQAEIDFVLYNDFNAVAFEVKSVHRTMARGSGSFSKRYSECSVYTISIQDSPHSATIPLEEFLKTNPIDYLK